MFLIASNIDPSQNFPKHDYCNSLTNFQLITWFIFVFMALITDILLYIYLLFSSLEWLEYKLHDGEVLSILFKCFIPMPGRNN